MTVRSSGVQITGGLTVGLRREVRARRVTVSKLKKRPVNKGIEAMIRERAAQWGGGKPRGARRPPKIRGPSVADAVIQDRR